MINEHPRFIERVPRRETKPRSLYSGILRPSLTRDLIIWYVFEIAHDMNQFHESSGHSQCAPHAQTNVHFSGVTRSAQKVVLETFQVSSFSHGL